MRLFFTLMAVILFALPAHAQIQPNKPLDLPAIRAAIDTLPTGGQITITFNFSTTEIQGNIQTNEEIKKNNDKRRQVVEAIFKQKPTDHKLAIELFELARDTSEQFMQGQLCLSLLEAKLRETPEDGELYYEAGKVFQSAFRYEQAIQQYENAQKYMPDSAKIYRQVGAIYFYTQQYPQAKQIFEEALKRDDSDLNAHLMFVVCDVFKSMGEMLAHGRTDTALLEYAQTMQQDVQRLENAIKKYPKRKDLQDLKNYARLFWIFYKGFMTGNVVNKDLDLKKRENIRVGKLFKINDTDLKELKKLEKDFLAIAKNKNIKNPALAYEAIAMIALITNDDKKALQHLEKANKLNPEKATNYFNRAFMYFVQKNDAEVEKIMRQKMRIEKKPSDYATIAAIYKQSDNYQKAKAICKEGINEFIKTPSEELHTMLGMFEANTSNYAEAEMQFIKVIAINLGQDNTKGEISYKIGLMELAQEKWADANETLMRGATLGHEGCKKLWTTYFEK